MKRGEFGLHAVDDELEIKTELRGPAQGYSGKYVDDMSKQVLKDSLVQEARAKELLYPLAQSAHPAAARLQTVGLSSEGRRAKLDRSVLQREWISFVVKGKLISMTVFHWF